MLFVRDCFTRSVARTAGGVLVLLLGQGALFSLPRKNKNAPENKVETGQRVGPRANAHEKCEGAALMRWEFCQGNAPFALYRKYSC